MSFGFVKISRATEPDESYIRINRNKGLSQRFSQSRAPYIYTQIQQQLHLQDEAHRRKQAAARRLFSSQSTWNSEYIYISIPRMYNIETLGRRGRRSNPFKSSQDHFSNFMLATSLCALARRFYDMRIYVCVCTERRIRVRV